MSQSAESYQSFLLRCWQAPATVEGDPSVWRFVVRDISAEPTEHAFSSLEQLMAFVAAELQKKPNLFENKL
jgi:hypothetical protein